MVIKKKVTISKLKDFDLFIMMTRIQTRMPSSTVNRSLEGNVTWPSSPSEEQTVYHLDFCGNQYRWKCSSPVSFSNPYYWTIYHVSPDRHVIKISDHETGVLWLVDDVEKLTDYPDSE